MSMQINLQHVFKMSASRTHACFESPTPLVNGCIDDVLFNTAPKLIEIGSFLTTTTCISKLLLCFSDIFCNHVFHVNGLRLSSYSIKRGCHLMWCAVVQPIAYGWNHCCRVYTDDEVHRRRSGVRGVSASADRRVRRSGVHRRTSHRCRPSC